MAWTKQKALVRQNTRFDVLKDKILVIPPAKFTGQYEDIEWFLDEVQQYLDETEVMSPKWQVLIALSRMQDDQWVNTMRNVTTALYDDIPYVWDQFIQWFKAHFTQQHWQAELSDQLARLQMHNQKLEIYANNFKKLTNELKLARDNTFFLALFIHGLTNQLCDTIQPHEVQNYEGLWHQVEENLLDMQRDAKTKQAIIHTAFFQTHPELEGLDWQAPLVQKPWSQHQWKKEQRIAQTYSPNYPPLEGCQRQIEMTMAR